MKKLNKWIKNIILNIILLKNGVGFTMKFTMKQFSRRNKYLQGNFEAERIVSCKM